MSVLPSCDVAGNVRETKSEVELHPRLAPVDSLKNLARLLARLAPCKQEARRVRSEVISPRKKKAEGLTRILVYTRYERFPGVRKNCLPFKFPSSRRDVNFIRAICLFSRVILYNFNSVNSLSLSSPPPPPHRFHTLAMNKISKIRAWSLNSEMKVNGIERY